MRRNFYPGGHVSLSATRAGAPEGTQQLAAIKRKERRPCPRAGCERYEKGWDVVLNLADDADANAARYIREGKTMRRYEELALISGVVSFRFWAGQPCLGHAPDWHEPVLLAGDRKVTMPEWEDRYEAGAEALIAATTRLREIEED